MKNLKIGAKIFVSFGVVIAFMLLSAAFVFFSNRAIIDNVDKISKDSLLQTTGNTLKDNFLLTRTAAVRLLSTTDAATYDSFVKQADQATKNYSEIYAIIDENSFLEKFRAPFQQAEADYLAYVQKAHELGASNAAELEQIENMNAAGSSLAEYGNLIFVDQIELLRGEVSEGVLDQNAQFRRADRIETGSKIAQNIAEFRLYSREMAVSFDTANLPLTLELMDETYAILEAYYNESTLIKNIEHSKLLMDNISTYRIALIEFAAACDHAAQVAQELSPLGETALNSLSAAVSLLDDAMQTQVQSTTTSASSTLLMVMAISLLSIICAVILALVIMKGITVPIGKMVRAADALALGDINVDVSFDSKDEIGSLAISFEKMLDGIKAQVDIVEHLADGDLTIDVKPRSDQDKMGFGLQQMVGSLNEMFGDIRSSTAQVSVGSKQIADGAQSLAQGSTEQASAVEQLSNAIAEIAHKTSSNAQMAIRAADLATTIKESAEKGSLQMDQMMTAVQDINQASQSINKVIKVIDDIAFQTNILALNAAVEAARAGQHGKGFAVVAEEVRNLAAKSAEAAKDTGGLIANSMEKAELGARIADETAASLAEIVSGINESTVIVGDIAKSSEEQAEGISQVNKGIDQVAQVVQQNSATAEESAAASQQMSGQSEALEQLVAQFKLKEGKGYQQARLGAPAQAPSLPEIGKY